MSEDELRDQHLAHLINQPMAFGDSAAFERRVVHALEFRLMWRKAVIGLAGLTGGLYALGQLISLPEAPQRVETPVSLTRATIGTEETFSQGLRWFDSLSHRIADALQLADRSIDFVHQPVFFWGSFAICATLIALYFIQNQEGVL